MARETRRVLLEESDQTNGITRRTGLPTGVTSCMQSKRRRARICGRCPSLANGHRSTSRGHRLRKSNARFSPDSRWVAYQSNETGQSRDLRSALPGPRTEVAGVRGRRHDAALAARRRRAVLPRARQAPDGRVRRADAARVSRRVLRAPCSRCRPRRATNPHPTASGFSSPRSYRRPAPSPSSSTGSRPNDAGKPARVLLLGAVRREHVQMHRGA